MPAGKRAAKQYEKAKAVNAWDSGAALHKQEQAAQFENINIRLLEKVLVLRCKNRGWSWAEVRRLSQLPERGQCWCLGVRTEAVAGLRSGG